MLNNRGSVIDRRSGEDRRIAYNPDYLLNGGKKRRSWIERRSQDERRVDWIRLSKWYSIPLRLITRPVAFGINNLYTFILYLIRQGLYGEPIA